jgi:hypothetical protein
MFGDMQWNFALEVFLYFFWAVHNSCHGTKPTDCQVLICKLFVPFTYLCLNFQQAIIIIAKLSFWINKPFLPSVTKALDQYKQRGYVQQIKAAITPDFMHDQDLVILLHGQVTHHTNGMLFV